GRSARGGKLRTGSTSFSWDRRHCRGSSPALTVFIDENRDRFCHFSKMDVSAPVRCRAGQNRARRRSIESYPIALRRRDQNAESCQHVLRGTHVLTAGRRARRGWPDEPGHGERDRATPALLVSSNELTTIRLVTAVHGCRPAGFAFRHGLRRDRWPPSIPSKSPARPRPGRKSPVSIS